MSDKWKKQDAFEQSIDLCSRCKEPVEKLITIDKEDGAEYSLGERCLTCRWEMIWEDDDKDLQFRRF